STSVGCPPLCPRPMRHAAAAAARLYRAPPGTTSPPGLGPAATGRRDRLRITQVVALGVVDPEPAYEVQRLLVPDEFGHRLLAQCPGDVDDALDQVPVHLAAGQVADETPVDLDHIHR